MLYRQGDVALIPVPSIPAGAVKGKRDNTRGVVLAEGEVTGHYHAIADAGVAIMEHEGTRYIRVPKRGATLRHDEHGPIAVEEGSYRVVIQREYSPQELRNVRD